MPGGRRWVRVRAEAVELAEQLPEIAGPGYANGRRTRLAVYAALVDFMAPDGSITAGYGRLAERASVHAGRSVAPSTARYHVAALVAAGAVLVAESGASSECLDAVRDRAPTYALLAPAPPDVEQVDPSTLTPAEAAEFARLSAQLDALPPAPGRPVDELCTLPEGTAHALAEDIYHPRKGEQNRRSKALSEPATPARRATPGRFAPRSAADRALAVDWLLIELGWCRERRAEENMTKIASPGFAAGWSPQSIMVAWQRRPDGEPWPSLPGPHERDAHDRSRARNRWAVLTHRLNAWRGPDGQLGDPPVPVEQPRRGRPRKPPAPPAGPIVVNRPADVDAALTALSFRLADRRAAQLAERERRAQLPAARPAPTPAAAPPTGGQLPPDMTAALIHRRAVLRARIERQARADWRDPLGATRPGREPTR